MGPRWHIPWEGRTLFSNTVRRGRTVATTACSLLLVLLLLLSCASRTFAAVQLGDLLVADSHNSNGNGVILGINPVTGAQSLVASGGLLDQPAGVTFDNATATLVVADFGGLGAFAPGRILRINPFTGQQSVLASGGNVLHPTGVAFDLAGNLLVTQQDAAASLLRINPATGAQTVVTAGQNLGIEGEDVVAPSASAYYVSTFTRPGTVTRVDAATGAQTVVSSFDIGPRGLTPDATHPGTVLLASSDFSHTGSKPNGLYRIDLATGQQTLLSSGGLMDVPLDVIQNPNGLTYLTNRTPSGAADILLVDLLTGAQTPIASGNNLLTPNGIAVVTSTTAAAAPLPRSVYPATLLLLALVLRSPRSFRRKLTTCN